MRIIIETTSQGELSVVQDGQAAAPGTAASGTAADLDGGGAPQELIELLGGTAGKGPGIEASAGRSASAEDAGAPPDWLVDVIESQ